METSVPDFKNTESIQVIGFIGLGLIGGSIAKSLRVCHPGCEILAYQYNEHSARYLAKAMEEGTLTGICHDIKDLSRCDIIFLCAPVSANMAYLEKLKPVVKPTCLITDVGSVKGSIHQAVLRLDMDGQFIGGHPMAGSEKTGYDHASRRLLENAYYILTPTPRTPENYTALMSRLVKDMGAIPVILDSREHDNITAAISHVPHIIAAALVNMVHDSDDSRELMKSLAAGGFKDITRIASSSPEMWESICMTNQESILDFLDRYTASLNEFKEMLHDGRKEDIYQTFSRSRDYRDSIPSHSQGLFGRVYDLYVDIPDETGAIAMIASMMAANAISIKNIGIIHNREFADGVLRIELYDEQSMIKTAGLLKNHYYTIYEH
ncbi:prephenate dehydrogenase [Anaerolentibacter hominis]|uniref:prephenate dehydrogenase n=1 Tax=Anaerolentibacter hominis TaxID=3079009 RepID=UPI0031B7EAFC